MQSVGFHALYETQLKQVQGLLEAWRKIPAALVVFSLGVLPRVCEELFFRGFLLSSLRREMNVASGIVVAAVGFRLCHVVLAGGAAPERFIPSTIMGLLLGWVTWRCGGVIPAMVLHGMHNSTLLLIASHDQALEYLTVRVQQQTHLPSMWLATSALMLLLGFAWTAAANANRIANAGARKAELVHAMLLKAAASYNLYLQLLCI